MSISVPTPAETPLHPLVAAARELEAVLDSVTGIDPMYATTTDKATLLLELTRIGTRVAALRAGVLAVAADVAQDGIARTPGAWLARESHLSPREGLGEEHLGVALRDRWHHVAEAAATGAVTWEQAQVLVRCLEDLPGDLDAVLLGKAEAHLVAEAAHFGPAELRRLGRHVLEVVAPDLAEHHQLRALEAEEHRARATTRLSFRPRGDGTTDLFARLPDHVAGRLRAYLDSYTAPRRTHLDQAAEGGSDVGSDVAGLSLPRRRGEAFCALLEHVPAHGLPRHGGTPTQVLVTIDLETLTTGLGLAETSTGHTITATQARRMACTAGLLPAVLGGKGEVLDLGRTRRLFTPAQRKALAIRDRTCRAEGCNIPAAWCEAHHAQAPWSHGGKTDLADGLLLCSYHHHRAHDPKYDTSRTPNGDLRYHRRT
jgi:hypothetical protein